MHQLASTQPKAVRKRRRVPTSNALESQKPSIKKGTSKISMNNAVVLDRVENRDEAETAGLENRITTVNNAQDASWNVLQDGWRHTV